MAKKIFVENEELQATVDALSVVEGTVELLLGAKAVGENVLCMASSVSTGGEQIQVQFAALKPTNHEDNYLMGVFNGKELLGLLRGVLALKDRVYFEQTNHGWFVGVGQDVRLPISTLAERPEKIAFIKAEQLFQAQVSMTTFVEALRGGSFMTAFGEDDRGLSNAVVRVIPDAITEEAALSGSLGVYSSNGHALSKAAATCVIANTGNVDANGYKVAFPKKAVNNLCKLLSGKDGTAALGVDKTHVSVAVGKRIMYTFTQGAKCHDVVFKSDEWDKQAKPVVYILDNEDLKQKIGLLTSVADLTSSNKPIRLVMEEGKDLVIQLSGSDAEIRIAPVSSRMEGNASVCFSGKKVQDVLNLLKKGNVRVSFLTTGKALASSPVEFSNGDLAGNAENSVLCFLMPVKDVTGDSQTESSKGEESKAKEGPKGEPETTAPAEPATEEATATDAAETSAEETESSQDDTQEE